MTGITEVVLKAHGATASYQDIVLVACVGAELFFSCTPLWQSQDLLVLLLVGSVNSCFVWIYPILCEYFSPVTTREVNLYLGKRGHSTAPPVFGNPVIC